MVLFCTETREIRLSVPQRPQAYDILFRSCSPFSVICFGKPPKTRTWNPSVMGRRGYLTQQEKVLLKHTFFASGQNVPKIAVLREMQVGQMEPTGDCGAHCYVCRSLQLENRSTKLTSINCVEVWGPKVPFLVLPKWLKLGYFSHYQSFHIKYPKSFRT